MRLAIEAHPDWVILKLDFKNAFNTVARLAFLRWTAANFPILLPFLQRAYSSDPFIHALGPDGWVRFLGLLV